MFRRFALSILILSSSSMVQAEIDEASYINLYRKEFDKKVAANLYASPAENKSANEYRAEIIDFLLEKEHKIPKLVLKKRWRQHLEQFKGPEEYQEKLSNAYLNNEFVRKKFLQNQYINDYFRLKVARKAREDLNERNKIIELAKEQKIDVSNHDIDERLLQFIENQGGKVAYKAFLSDNNFKEKDIKFFIKTDLLKEALVSKMLESEIDIASENHYQNKKSERKPRYYFTQAFIPVTSEDAEAKIKAAQKVFENESAIFAYEGIDPNIKVSSMDVAVSLDTKLFAEEIKDQLIKLSNNGSMISSKVSDLIKTDKGYHLIQINGVEVSESISYEEAREDRLKQLKEQRAKDFDGLYSFFVPETNSQID